MCSVSVLCILSEDFSNSLNALSIKNLLYVYHYTGPHHPCTVPLIIIIHKKSITVSVSVVHYTCVMSSCY